MTFRLLTANFKLLLVSSTPFKVSRLSAPWKLNLILMEEPKCLGNVTRSLQSALCASLYMDFVHDQRVYYLELESRFSASQMLLSLAHMLP